MRNIITSCLVLASLLASASSAFAKGQVSIADKINALKISDAEKADFRAAYDDFYKASEVVYGLKVKYGLVNDSKPVVKADVVDPTIRKIQQQARKYHNRFEVLNKTVKKWGPSTNLLARAARQSMQSRLDDERDVSKWTSKIWKAKLQAEKKDQKNYESWVKDTEKARDKSSTELAEFFQAILDQAAAAREE